MLRNKDAKCKVQKAKNEEETVQSSYSLQKRKAAVSTELVIGIALAVVALFLVIGLFNNNLKNMIVNSNISRMWGNNAQKTDWNEDPSQAQQLVQLTGSQGLEYYLTQAQDAIAKYKANPPKNEAEMEDLAKQATIAKIIGYYGDSPGLSAEDEIYFSDTYKIFIDLNYGETSIGDNKKIYYNQNNGINALPDKNVKLLVAKEITSGTFK